ncbi:MAG: flavin reductase family protein [Candidatus Thorarchaeota archaeon]|nr:MAG: flavin reductase family protein [Candidatus Thorarchaeota archaeon]
MKREMRPFTAIVPSPVVLLSVAGEDYPNIITLSWAANICSKPPSVAVGIRQNRFSYELISKANDFVLNIPTVDLLEATEFSGSKSGRDFNKFAECGLTPIPSKTVSSPMIKECPINIECIKKQILPIGVHDLFIAEVVKVHMNEDVLDEEGHLDLTKAKLFTYIPATGQYWSLGDKLESLD